MSEAVETGVASAVIFLAVVVVAAIVMGILYAAVQIVYFLGPVIPEGWPALVIFVLIIAILLGVAVGVGTFIWEKIPEADGA